MNWLTSIEVGCVLAVAAMSGCNDRSPSADNSTTKPSPIKIGFIVKQPEEPWFQVEWKFAGQAADADGFELIKIGASDGEKALAAIDNLSASGAQGFVICTPDTKLGPAIMKKAQDDGLKVIAVDDQFLDVTGKSMTDVHYLGISAQKIGQSVGHALIQEMKKRNWPANDTAVCAVTFEELETARQRTDGAIEALKNDGFPDSRIYKAPQKTSDIPGAFDAVNILLTQMPNVKHWLICGMNDSGVLGGVRATEGRGLKAEDVIGIGIDGTDCSPEFEKPNPTGFFASVLLSARQHGYQTSDAMYQWIKNGTEPPLDTRTAGVMINRANFHQMLKDQGIRQ